MEEFNEEDMLIIETIKEPEEGEAGTVEQVLNSAAEKGLEFAIVIGQYPNGEWYFAANQHDFPRANWAVDVFKNFLMENYS